MILFKEDYNEAINLFNNKYKLDEEILVKQKYELDRLINLYTCAGELRVVVFHRNGTFTLV